MLLVVAAALAQDPVAPEPNRELSDAILEADASRVARRTTATVGVGFTLLSASVVPMVVAWPVPPDPNHYVVEREEWNDSPLEYRQRLERRSDMLHADRQAYVRATWSRTTMSATLAAAGIAALALSPAWTLDLRDRAEAEVSPTGVEVTF